MRGSQLNDNDLQIEPRIDDFLTYHFPATFSANPLFLAYHFCGQEWKTKRPTTYRYMPTLFLVR